MAKKRVSVAVSGWSMLSTLLVMMLFILAALSIVTDFALTFLILTLAIVALLLWSYIVIRHG